MNYQNPPRKSLGTLYRAEKTKPRSPDMTGTLKIQMHTLRELFELSQIGHNDKIACPIAAWVNGDGARKYLVVELSPPYRPKPRIPDPGPGPTLESFFAEIIRRQ
jgi:hypothetical protein